MIALAPASRAVAQSAGKDLARLSLQELADVEVTSVSKSSEPLSRAPAAIYVISHDDILRSGVTSIPEALRLAPNLQVRQLTSTSYAITARGFGGNQGAQNFSNKLLILIDGRSVYTPLFSGVYFDAQDVLLEDVDRIEVISGPGATLWGANAMNGVINIVTRPAYLTQGGLIAGGVGNQEQDLGAHYGGKLDPATAYRVYAMGFHRNALERHGGASAFDAWDKAQLGFRLDASFSDDTLTVQGDAYRALEDQPGASTQLVTGANVLGRWQHHTAHTDLQLQGYFDDTQRGAFVLHTYDLQLQHTILTGERNRIIWGAGERLNRYTISSSPTLFFRPASRTLTLGNLFLQDTLTLLPSLDLTLGTKLEDDPYAGWSWQPDARLSFQLTSTTQLWAAVSRAVRSPTPFDEDVQEKVGSVLFLTGNRAFKPERVNAYEIGYRGAPLSTVSLSVSLFYNHYDDLRTINTTPNGPPPFGLPIYWGNAMEGNTYGVEVWADLQVARWWRVSPGFRSLHKSLRFLPGFHAIAGISQAGDDPSAEGFLTSSIDVGPWLTFDASLRYVNPLPSPALPGYYDMSTRLAWRVSRRLEIALSGMNLLHARHLEYPAPAGEEIPRSGMLQARWQL